MTICPLRQWLETIKETPDGMYKKLFFECDNECAWYDEKKKQCCIKTLAQKDNSKISVAR